MKNQLGKLLTFMALGCTLLFFLGNCATDKGSADVSILINGEKKLQQIDGFGVNANTASWGNTELIPALDLLTDSLNANIWRVVVETEQNWEVTNDNNDPFTFNQDFYNQLYETQKFQRVWEQIEYLNKKGINDKLIISIMGGLPKWMGYNIILPEMEDEFIEMHVSFLDHAINKRHLKFGLYSPINETDLTNAQIEGPHTNAEQFVRIEHKLVDRLNELGLNNIQLISPDVANMQEGIDHYLPTLINDNVVMSKVKFFGLHSYNGYYTPVDSFIQHSNYRHTPIWITEFNAWRNGLDHGETGLYNYEFAVECVKHLLDLLKNGASACVVWEGYDSVYEHHGAMSYWGVLELDEQTKTFSPRKHFFALAQVFKFVPAGALQIEVIQSDRNLTVLAFNDSVTGRLSIVGIHSGKKSITSEFDLKHLTKLQTMELFYTDSVKNFYNEGQLKVTKQKLETTIPANCIFTLTGVSDK